MPYYAHAHNTRLCQLIGCNTGCQGHVCMWVLISKHPRILNTTQLSARNKTIPHIWYLLCRNSSSTVNCHKSTCMCRASMQDKKVTVITYLSSLRWAQWAIPLDRWATPESPIFSFPLRLHVCITKFYALVRTKNIPLGSIWVYVGQGTCSLVVVWSWFKCVAKGDVSLLSAGGLQYRLSRLSVLTFTDPWTLKIKHGHEIKLPQQEIWHFYADTPGNTNSEQPDPYEQLH